MLPRIFFKFKRGRPFLALIAISAVSVLSLAPCRPWPPLKVLTPTLVMQVISTLLLSVWADTIQYDTISGWMHRFRRTRVLVLLTGQPRGGELAWHSLKENVLAPLHADLAVLFQEPFDR